MDKRSWVKLLKKLDHTPNLDDAKKLIPYLYAYDESADKLVKQLHQQVGFVKGQQLIKDYLTDHKSVLPPFKYALDSFFKQIDTSPSWLNWDLLEKGIGISQRSGLNGLIVLRDYCLMGGYESAAINKPLIYTGALKKEQSKDLLIQLNSGLISCKTNP